MTQPTLAPSHLTVVLDRSGSMQAVRDDAIGGFNAFLAEQRGLGADATFTLVQFDTQYEVVHRGVPLATVPDLDRATFVPRGSTALQDAIGRAIVEALEHAERVVAQGGPAPAVIIAILTDGHENASREFSHAHLRALIRERTAAGWSFLFLAANLDADAEATRLGMAAGSAMAFTSNGAGTHDAFARLSRAVRDRRGGTTRASPSGSRGR